MISQEDLYQLRLVAQAKLIEAERAYYRYAVNTEVGREREIAFEIYEKVRNVARVN